MNALAIKATPALGGLALRRLFAGKRQIVLAITLAVPVLIALLVSLVSQNRDLDPERIERFFHLLMTRYVLYLMIILLGIVFAISLSSGDIEEGTAGYLFLTVLPRWWIALVHLVVAASVLSLLICASILATLTAWRMGAGGAFSAADVRMWISYSVIAAFGVTAHLAFFSFCGYAFRRPVAWSIGAVVLWELIVTHMPIRLGIFTVTNNLRALVNFGILNGEATYLYRYARKSYQFPDYAQAALTISIIIALFIAATMIAVMNRDIEGKESN